MASLADIVANIKDTNDLLKDNVAAQQRVFDLMDDAARKEKEARMDDLQSTKASKTKAVRGGASGFSGSFKEGLGLGSAFGAASSLIGGLLGKLTIPLLAAAAYAFDQIAFKGAGLKNIKEWGKNLITGIIDKLDFLNIFSDKEQTDIATSIIKAAGPALLVGLFSKKAGLAVFIGGLFANYVFDKVFTDEQKKEMEESFNEGVKSMLGIDVTNAFLFKLGVGLAGLFGLPLILGTLSFALTGVTGLFTATGKGGAKMKLLPRLLKNFRRGFLGKFGVGLALFSLGEMIGDAAEDATDGTVKSDAVQNVINAAIIGSMFGLRGALIAAIGAVALESFKYLTGKVRAARSKEKDQAQLDVLAAKAKLDFMIDNGTAEDIKLAKQAYGKALNARKKQFMITPNKFKDYTVEEREAILGTSFKNGQADFIAEGFNKFKSNIGESGSLASQYYTGIGDDNLNPYDMTNKAEQDRFRALQAAAKAAKAARDAKGIDRDMFVPGLEGGNFTGAPVVLQQSSQSGSNNTTAVTILSDNKSLFSSDAALAGVMSSGDIKVYA